MFFDLDQIPPAPHRIVNFRDPDLDISRAVNVFEMQHGRDAPLPATTRVDKLLEVGDFDGYAVFK